MRYQTIKSILIHKNYTSNINHWHKAGLLIAKGYLGQNPYYFCLINLESTKELKMEGISNQGEMSGWESRIGPMWTQVDPTIL